MENPEIKLPTVHYKPLSDDPREAFSCGVAEIDKWFKGCQSHHNKFRHRVTTVHNSDDGSIVAFYALSIKLESERMLTSSDKSAWRDSFNSSDQKFICLNLDYLAVASAHQRKFVGTVVMGRVIEEFANIAMSCGIEIMTGSAISTKIFQFYQRLGFKQYGFSQHTPQMFLPALSAIDVVKGAAV